MRKLLYTFAALASMLAMAASCQRETPLGSSPDGDLIDVSMNFTVDDGRPATKAIIGDGLTANKLTFLAYDEKGNYLSQLTPTNAGYENLTSKAGTVNLKVVKGMKYKFVFIASSENAKTNYFTLSDDKKTLTLSYTAIATAQKEDSDFFYHLEDNFAFSASGEAKGVTLKRPLAQLNVGSTAEDFTVASNSGIDTDALKTGYKLTSIPNKLNLLDGTVSGEADITLGTATRPSETLTVSSTNYAWVSMAYVLVGTGSQNTDVTLNVDMTNTGGEALSSIERAITAVPLKRNYRTNILGNIFSIDAMFNVSVDNAFEDNTNKLIGPSYASVAELNSYFATFANNADNGNVDPEVVTLTAIEGTPGSIVLPDYAGRVQIRITASYGETLTLAYPDGATNKPATVEIYAPSLSALSGEITSTHVTILGGSVINTTSLHTSDSTLEIQEGATVNTVNILKGNALIAGTVATVDVPSGATADGENPVQVFVAKEAAIQSITLKAESDVVVEQPKDHIDVVATEKKIAVYVMEGADNSTAKAQKGGVIYVRASVPCTVTADGTSVAEDGSSVSSTVIIDEGANGSMVNATNGGAIALTANDNCVVTASGASASEDPAQESIPSSVTIEAVEENVTVNTETSDDATIEAAEGAEIEGDIKKYVAAIGEVKYTSLAEAFAAAQTDDEIILLADCEVDSYIPVACSLTLNLNGKTITNNVSQARMLDLSAMNITMKIIDSGELGGGKLYIPSTNVSSYGFVRMSAFGQKVVLKGITLEGATDSAALLRYNQSSQTFEIEDCHIILTDGLVGSIIYSNGNFNSLSIKNTDIINHSTALAQNAMFSCAGVTAECENVTYNGEYCPTGFYTGNSTYTDCSVIAQTQEPLNMDSRWPWLTSALSTSNGYTLTVNSGTYKAKYGVFLFSSGGTININGGSFEGPEAAVNMDNNTWEPGYAGASAINITGGSFKGTLKASAWGAAGTQPIAAMSISGGTFTVDEGKPLFTPSNASISITGGTFSQDPSAYVAEGYGARKIGESTWEVVEGTFLTFTEFNEQLLAANGVYDGTGKKVFVILSASERSIRNNNTAQFYLGRGTGEQINGIPSVSVKHVTFTYNHDADDGTTPLNTGEVYATAMNISFEDCTFTDNSGLSSWGYLGSDAYPPQSMVVKNCTFSDLSGRYAIHQNRAKEFTVEGCTFANCQRGIHTNSPAPESVVVKNNTFSGISDDYGVLCLAEGMGDMSEKTVEVTGNIATGQAFLRLLCTLNLTQYNAIKDNNTYETLHCIKSNQDLIPTE